MEIANWQTTQPLNALYRDIRELGLESNVAEIDNFGFTIIEPDKTGVGPDFIERLRNAVLDVAEKRNGVRPDIDKGSTHENLPMGTGDMHSWILFEDRVFEEALMARVPLAMLTYLLGESFRLSVFNSFLKGPGEVPTYLHNDTGVIGVPTPLAPYSQVANATWVLSDYDKEGGALCFVPGSHRWCRSPNMNEMFDFDAAVPVVAKPGALVVWHGNTWHGAFPRTKPGLRVALAMGGVRQYLEPFEDFKTGCPQEAIDRNPERFAIIMGRKVFAGYRAEGPDYSKVVQLPRGHHD